MRPVTADSVKREPVEWLWREHIPLGMISLVAGTPGVGKSLFGYFLAAAASQTGPVIYSTWEESWRKTARARLEAAGAHLESVVFWTPELPEDTNRLRHEIEERDAKLVVLDPIAAHLSVSIYNDQDVRRALSPLKAVAEETNAAVLLVSHTVKAVAKIGHPMDAIGGSGGGLRAAARIAFLFGRNPEDAEELWLTCVKSNIGPEPPTFTFELDVHEFDDVGDAALLVERGHGRESLEDARLMLDSSRTAGIPNERRSAAAEWLVGYLRLGPRPVSELKEDAKQYGHSWATTRRAADDLGVDKPKGGPNSSWSLPDDLIAKLEADGDA